MGSNPHGLTLFFCLIPLMNIEVVGSVPTLNLYVLFNSISLDERLWVQIPLLSFLIFRITFSVKVTGSNPPYNIPLTYIIILNFNMLRSRVQHVAGNYVVFQHLFHQHYMLVLWVINCLIKTSLGSFSWIHLAMSFSFKYVTLHFI